MDVGAQRTGNDAIAAAAKPLTSSGLIKLEIVGQTRHTHDVRAMSALPLTLVELMHRGGER